ncbi:MAG: hypothetical protein ACRD0C_19145 [Acidimicrobiia bacterium]
MLGEIVLESAGRITNVKVLEAAGENSKVEVSLQGQGKLLGTGMMEIASYWQQARANGTFYGEGGPVWMTESGDVLSWSGFGTGRPTGPGFSATYAVCGTIQTNAKAYAHLAGIATVGEYQVDEAGNYQWTLWEWKPAGV